VTWGAGKSALRQKPTQTKLPAHEKGGMETKVETYDGCQQGAQVVSYSVKGGGNTWPGGEQYEVEKQVGKTSQDLNANETIWSFLVTKKLEVKSETDNSGKPAAFRAPDPLSMINIVISNYSPAQNRADSDTDVRRMMVGQNWMRNWMRRG
jgi:hypothetical protein